MNREELPPLPADVLDWIEAERQRPALPEDFSSRVLDRVRGTVQGPAPKLPDGIQSPGPLGAASKFLVVFAVGAVAGAAVHARLSQAPEPSPISAEVPPPSAPALAPPVAEVSERPVERSQGVRVRQPPSPPATTAVPAPQPAAGDLARERLFLERARMAIARNDLRAALDALDAHAAEFALGALVEEREALAVRVLIGLGEHAAAETRAAAFVERFPHSALRPVVEQLSRDGNEGTAQ
jgi:hypothetical protein